MLIAHAAANFDATDPAFIHAVGLAAHSGAELATLHVTQGRSERIPDARELLVRWGMASDRVVQRVFETPGHEDIAEELVGACRALQPELIVLSTHARKGLAGMLAGSVAEAVARNSRVPNLLLPYGCTGFVDAQSGRIDLARILVLGGSSADAQLGLDAAGWLVHSARQPEAELTLLHVEDGQPMPVADQRVRNEVRRGELAATARGVAAERDAALLVMVSRGHDQLRDVLWSSHTERVLHAVARPLLWVPADWAGFGAQTTK
jgi:nucleotide-binding universal stress UspA family protein